jgi:hippurate hydrolase
VVSVTEILTDGARNVIPSNVTIKGDCRTFSEANTALVEKRLGEIANATAAMYGATCNFNFSREFIVSVNSAAETEAAASAALTVNGPQKVDADCEPRSFSEDFAHMQKVVPGCYVFLGNGTDSVGGCMLHNPSYDFNDEILATGANYWVALVEQQLGT